MCMKNRFVHPYCLFLVSVLLWACSLSSCCFVRCNLNTPVGNLPHWDDAAWKVVEFEYCDDFLTEYTSASGQKHYVVRGKYTMERTPGRALHVHDIDLYHGRSWQTEHEPRRTEPVEAEVRVPCESLGAYGIQVSGRTTDPRDCGARCWRWYLRHCPTEESTMVAQRQIPLRHKPGLEENPAVMNDNLWNALLYEEVAAENVSRYVVRPVVNLLIDWPVTLVGSAAASVLYTPFMFF